ncbi:MAG: OmpA family protein [Gemmatimonadota bacterium]|nr:OmpA family protein [Gemmatimonadota bacterium]
MRSLVGIVASLTVVCALGAPREVRGQGGEGSIFDRIGKAAAARAAAKKAKLDSAVMASAAKAVDSSLDKAGRGTEAVMNKTASLVDTAMNKTEAGVTNVVSRKDATAEKIAADLAAGGAVIWDITFADKSDELTPSGGKALGKLAKVLKNGGGPGVAYMLVAHVDASGDADADQLLSVKRAQALKAKLATMGVASPLFASGQGSSHPPTNANGQTGNARVEVTKS